MGSPNKTWSVLAFLLKFYGLGVPAALARLVYSVVRRAGRRTLLGLLGVEAARHADPAAAAALRASVGTCVPWWHARRSFERGGEVLEETYVVQDSDLFELGGPAAAAAERTARAVYVSRPDKRHPDDPVVLYVHGGAFCEGLTPVDYALAAKITAAYQCTFPQAAMLALDYAGAEDGGFPLAALDVVQLYRAVCREFPRGPIWLVGSEAGGHLMLGLLQYLACADEEGLRWPRRAFCMTPWLNLTAWSADDAEYAAADADRSAVHGFLQRMAAAYCESLGEGAQKNPYVNIEANLNADRWRRVLENTEIHVAVDDCDVLAPQARRFAEQLGLPVTDYDHDELVAATLSIYGYSEDWLLDNGLAFAMAKFFYLH
ncbi:ADR047Wp [Eremothecium gossypii ATCC 10895]|uniref:ADR047Wp n=1 Tax=Eremothecium gossypii (strain ATCC 10895 / CBS 109.51 / FGSC 9923 / NRRL Y-1056) TaxID=284811 RepID=Q75A71_EREGS|nr:ADR047Wp [Eremothecium gossypii ATCC 10895]AAS51967.1 ADR047Wp [Eremothecium gossypii ATCC 10895]